MQARINNKLVAALKPDTRPYEVRDTKLTGFLIRVQPSGALSYLCEYGRGKRITFGKVGVLTPEQARDRARAILNEAALGIDPVNAEALTVLTGWQHQAGEHPGRVFPGQHGGQLHNVKSAWRTLLKAAGIGNFRWHDLRHHFASRLVMAGVDLNTVRELLGHSDIKMTLRYAHLAPEHRPQPSPGWCRGRYDPARKAVRGYSQPSHGGPV